MKRRILYLPIAALAASSLSSCLSSLLPSYISSSDSVGKEIGIYESEDKDGVREVLETGKAGEVEARFLEGEPLIPYLSLEGYASIFSSQLKQGYASNVTSDGDVYLWKVTNEKEEPIFLAAFDYKQAILTADGSLGDALTQFHEVDSAALTYQLKIETKILNEGKTTSLPTYSYRNCSISAIRYGTTCYLPLGIYELSLANLVGVHVGYDYSSFYLFSGYESLTTPVFLNQAEKDGGEEAKSILARMEETLSEVEQPLYLRKYNRDCFFFLMENFYGLSSTMGIKSMASYYSNQTWVDDFISPSPAARQKAFVRALNILDDDHTGLLAGSIPWKENISGAYPRGKASQARSLLRSNLSYERNRLLTEKGLEGGEVEYSQSGKTASFIFNAFSFGSSDAIFEEDGSVQENAYLFDAYFLFLHQIGKIKESGAKNVVIDISTNGGGIIGVLLKLMALMSKDNRSTMAYYNDRSDKIVQYTAMVDSNNDGAYDEKDVYGNDFDFYLLASACSFSCGNAFPYLCEKEGIAKVIGATSGGGECSVTSHILPNFQYISHSSNNHIGYAETLVSEEETSAVFYGDEGGNENTHSLPYSSFYDIEALERIVEEID